MRDPLHDDRQSLEAMGVLVAQVSFDELPRLRRGSTSGHPGRLQDPGGEVELLLRLDDHPAAPSGLPASSASAVTWAKWSICMSVGRPYAPV